MRKGTSVVKLVLSFAIILLQGMAVKSAQASSTLALSYPSVRFGDVAVGRNGAVSVRITNTGKESVVFSQASLHAREFSIIGFYLPKTLSGGESATFIVKFSPSHVGLAEGTFELASNASNHLVNLRLSGKGIEGTAATISSARLSATPSTVNFEKVPVGTTDTQSVELKNTGRTPLTISSLNMTGAGFKIVGLKLPHTLEAGQTVNFEAEFTPIGEVSSTGKLLVDANSGHVSSTVELSGMGVADVRSLETVPSLSFGSVALGKTSTLNVAVKNTGNSPVKISGLNVSGAGFSAAGIAPGLTIHPLATAVLAVELAPKAAGNASGSITITSNASDPRITIALHGGGVTGSADVKLNWVASASSGVEGYNVYRSSAGAAYSKLVSAPVAGTDYIDSTVQAGAEYSYMVTAVNTAGVESIPSNATVVTIP
jgi:Abnormal spindle-like microcephaly-assoc'd, ASPM-SPD-2-Hydin